MIKFFRRIRQQLVSQNRFSKYMLYAIGEIVLVVIGILIALSINNWNQNRLASKKQQALLSALHLEFTSNKEQLEEVVKVHERALENSQSITMLFPIDPKRVDLDSLEKKINYLSYRYTFNPSQGIINSLVNTSSFDIIENDSLRNILISWNDVLSDYQEEEILAQKLVNEMVFPFFRKHFSGDINLKDNRIDLKILKSLEFENLIYARESSLVDILEGTGDLENIRISIDKIIKLSKPYYK
jgi:hypothetical protein